MIRYLIFPLTKSPHSGRIGSKEGQDWYRGLVIARNMQRDIGGRILVLSNVQIAGEEHEADLYAEALKELGVKDEYIVVVKEAQETVEQIKIAKEIADRADEKLIVISAFLHYPRVRYLCRGLGVAHRIVFGIPRPREAVTDIILTFLFPVIDLLGLREKFLEKVQNRRIGGKH